MFKLLSHCCVGVDTKNAEMPWLLYDDTGAVVQHCVLTAAGSVFCRTVQCWSVACEPVKL